VLLISIDTLRADHLGCYGYSRDTSPRIDRLAGEGVTFDRAISSTSWTLPSHMAIFSSLFDSVHGVQATGRKYALDHPLLAEVMRSAGYRTAGFHSGPLLDEGYGFSAGFDSYVDCSRGAERRARRGEGPPHRRAPQGVGRPEKVQEEGLVGAFRRRVLRRGGGAPTVVTNPYLFERVSGWLEEGMEEPFFLFVHYWDVHWDYVPPSPYDTMFDPGYDGSMDFTNFPRNREIHPNMDPRDLEHLIALYDGEIRWTDEWIGKLIDRLEEKGVLDRTLVILTSDHGEEFFEHGKKGHRKALYDESIHVPLIVRYPDRLPAGFRVGGQVRTVDIYPTVLEMTGVGTVHGLQGLSLRPLMDDEPETADFPPAVSELSLGWVEMTSVRRNEHKTIQDRKAETITHFDLEKDPGEQRPIGAGEDPRIPSWIQELRDTSEDLERVKAAIQWVSEDNTFEPDPELLETLRSLGYVK
jgi:arylsulfatase A-like enzyme